MIAQAAEKLPGTYPQKAMWVKGAAISKFCVPTLGRLPSIKQVRAIRCELSFVVCRTQAGGPLALMFHGHTACVKFIAGNHISVLVATSNLDQVDKSRVVFKTNQWSCPFVLSMFQRQRWVEKANRLGNIALTVMFWHLLVSCDS